MKGTLNIPAVCIVIRQADKILFVKRANTGYEDGKYTIPAGHVEEGESFRTAAVREVSEEVGLQIVPSQLRHVHTQHTYKSDGPIRIHVFFEVDDWSGEPINKEPDVHSELRWLPADDLPHAEIMGLVDDALIHIQQGSTYAEFGWPESGDNL